MRRGVLPWLIGLAALLSMGCQDRIGDACGSSTDCSVTGDRQCDLSQPGGYCTVFACDPDTCPEGVCVEWRFNPSRTAETWCMKTCNVDGDCRVEYWCVSPSRILPNGDRVQPPAPELPETERIARIIDLQGNRATANICAARFEEPAPAGSEESLVEADAGM